MTGAGDLRERVALSRRVEINPDAPDDLGAVLAEWVEQVRCWAEFKHLRGSETVMAGRLQGRHPMVVRLRTSPQSRQVAADWRLTDLGTGTDYAIRDVTVTREWIDLLCEGGSAA